MSPQQPTLSSGRTHPTTFLRLVGTVQRFLAALPECSGTVSHSVQPHRNETENAAVRCVQGRLTGGVEHEVPPTPRESL
jgi:hypothetical protein